MSSGWHDDAVTPPEADARDVDVVLPTRDDPMLRDGAAGVDGLEGLGGPVGRRALLLASWWTPVRVTLLVLFGSLVAGYLLKAPCRDASVWVDEYQFTHLCYTDTLASFTAYGLDAGQWPYVGFATPYPPLIGAFMALAWMGSGVLPSSALAPGAAYWNTTVVMLAACAAVLVVTTALLSSRRRPWDALMLAVAPVLVLHAYTNWDLLPAALLGVAMVAWARRSPSWAGIWLGLAVAAKLYPAVLLVALLLLCLRAKRMREWTALAVTTVAVAAAVIVPLRLLAPEGSSAWWTENLERGPDWDSLWLPLSQAFGWDQGGAATNVRVAVASLLVVVAVAVLVRVAPRRPRVPAVTFVLLAGLLVVGKVFSPHDALWLTPLAVLSRPRWRMFLVWQAAEVMLFAARMYLLVGRDVPDKGLPIGWWYSAVVVRDVALLALVAFVVRDVLRPRHDVVREDGDDDPAGGVLDGAPEPDVADDDLRSPRDLEVSGSTRTDPVRHG